MSDRNFKEIRKQLRAVVREILPQVFTNELVAAAEDRLRTSVNQQLNQLSDTVQSSLNDLQERSKQVEAYIVRQSAQNAPAPETPLEPVASTA